MRAATILALSLATSLPAVAIDTQLYATMNVRSTAFFPVSGVDGYAPNLSLIDDPQAIQMQGLDRSASFGGGNAEGHFEGRVGLLRASASASFPYCCDAQGHRIIQGYADATVEARFYDTIAVSGAGLAPGTPVSYTVNFSIEGALSNPSFEIGGFLSAYGISEVRVRDATSFAEVYKRWDASRDATGLYSLTLDTFVGHTISISGMLAVGASVSDYAQTGRTAWADFAHSAGYQLVPSLAGLNTVGTSGWDFATSPVPEPGSGLLMGLGVAAWAWRRQSRPCSPRPNSKSAVSSAQPTASGGMARR